MAKKTKTSKRKKTAAEHLRDRVEADDSRIVLPVQFRSVGINAETLRVSVAIEPARLSLEKARHFFRNTQLQALLEADPNSSNDAEGQGRMIETVEASLEGVAICRKYSDGAKGYTASLNFQRTGIRLSGDDGLESLARFANCPGRLTLVRLGDAPERGDSEESGDESHETSE